MKNVEASVKFIRLNNGEDLVAYAYHVPADDVEAGHYILNDPLKIMYITNNATSASRAYMSISLMQWVFAKITDKQEFKILERDILTTSEPTKSLIDFYYETNEHFAELRERQSSSIEFSNENGIDEEEEFSEEDMLDEAEGLEMLNNLMEQLKGGPIDKKKLH